MSNKAAIIFGSFALGLTVGYLTTNHILKTRYQEIADQEIDSVKRAYTKVAENSGRKSDMWEHLESDEEVRHEPSPDQDPLFEKYEGAVVEQTHKGDPAIELPVFNKFLASKRLRDIDSVERAEENPVTETVIEGDNISIITWDEYSREFNHYDKVTYTYYEEDDVLLDYNDDIVADPESAVGDITTFDFKGSGSNKVVYVRNHDISTDIEVVLSQASYSEAILGYSDDDVQRTLRMRDIYE